MVEYDIIELQGNGKIRLHVPKREPTQEEIDELHKTVAEVVANIHTDSKKAANN